MWGNLFAQGLYMRNIFFCFLQTLFTLLFFIVINLESQCIFYHLAAFSKRSEQNPVRLALRNNVVPGRPYVRSGKQLHDIAQTGAAAVYGVIIYAIPMHHALNRHFIKINIEDALVIIKNYFYRG